MTKEKIIITPEELYVLGIVLNAKYIDYSYIATMKEIGSNNELFEKEMMNQLVKKELLVEDFAGNIIPKEIAIDVFTPLFFGELETTLDICLIEEYTKIQTYKFHFFGNQITKIIGTEDALEAEIISEEELINIVKSIDKNNTTTISQEKIHEFDKGKVTKLIVAKATHIAEKSVVKIFMESNGNIYKEDDGGEMVCLKIEDFNNEVLQILKGVI